MMRPFFRYIFLLLPALLVLSCSPARKTTGTASLSPSLPAYAEDYIRKYSELAVSEMRRTGIPASITMAQGMLESDYGRSYLARKGNNHFGIKCHSDWRGEKIYHDDDRRGECFRSYRSVEDSYKDHSDFLVNGSRYRYLFKLSSTDYQGWAYGLKKAGYATDIKYPALLIRKIDEYGLHYFDAGSFKAGKKTESARAVMQLPVEEQGPVKVISFGIGRTEETNRVQYVIVREGDTYESLAEEFQLLSWEISHYNDLAANTPLQPGQIIYLQPKRKKADVGFEILVIKEGETMYYISQKYAIRLSSLYKLNLMEEATECVQGQKVRLR